MHTLLVVLTLALTSVGHKGAIPTYLDRRDSQGNIVDRFGHDFLVQALSFSASQYASTTADVSVTPSLVRSGETVTVTWRDVPLPVKDNDWIGFFCPSNASNSDYLDWFHPRLVANSTYSKGYGAANFTLTDTRQECNFRYFQQSGSVAVSNSVMFSNDPIHGHLSLTDSPSSMRIEWVSASSAASPPVVLYGTDPKKMTDSADASVSTYFASDMCGPPASTTGFIPPGWLYTAVMTKLQPGTRYYYKYGPKNQLGPVLSFRSAPLPDPDYAFSFVVYADMGISADAAAQETARSALSLVDPAANPEGGAAEFVIHAGDISYARGAAYIWDRWFQLIEPIATKVPYQVGIGNHEYDHTGSEGTDPSGAAGTGFHPSWGNFGDDSNGECGVPMAKRFTMSTKKNGQ